MLESKLWKMVRENNKDYKFQRIENTAGLGTPDVYFSKKGNVGWAELKVINRMPVKDTTKIKIPFRPGQYGWLKEFSSSGTKCLLICLIKNRVYVFKNENIKQEYTKAELKSKASYYGYISGKLFE